MNLSGYLSGYFMTVVLFPKSPVVRKSEKPAKQANGHSDIFTMVDQAKARGVPQGAIRVM